ncbi:MAG: hypothetical protein H0T79_09535 [Deltaproteobacteria bacterium]|nr:hypothetical protein [Deltaproteobacteria bacterium]
MFLVTTVDEARAHGAKRACIAIDAALTRDDAEVAYWADRVGGPSEPRMMVVGMVIPPPPPPEPPRPTPGLLARIKGWFGR